MTKSRERWLFLGASSRVGRLVTPHLQQHTQTDLEFVYQTRRKEVFNLRPAIEWSPLDGPHNLLAGVQNGESMQGMIIFLGATPGQSADLTLNEKLAASCLDAALALGMRRVLIASSSAVYGLGKVEPFLEEDEPNPINEYGLAKTSMESKCELWRTLGLEVCCLRIGNVAGADALLKHLDLPDIREVDQFSDGLGPERSYIGPATLADVLISLARHPEPLPVILNVASPHPVRMTDLATAAGMDWKYVKTKSPQESQSITIDCKKLETLHRFAPEDSRSETMVKQIRDAR